MKHCCREMEQHVESEDRVLYYWEKFDEYLIPVHDGGTSGILIRYCPWCGASLPPSKRDEQVAEDKARE